MGNIIEPLTLKDTGAPKYKIIADEIREQIRSLTPGHNKLETEEVLAERTGTSRSTIRQAITQLIEEGYITRIQGKGMFGHPMVHDLKMRVDMDMNFRQILGVGGYRVSVSQSDGYVTGASPRLCKRFPEYESARVFEFHWTYFADNREAIFCRTQVPLELMKKNLSPIPAVSLKDLLKDICGMEVAFTTAWTKAVLDREAMGIFGLPENDPVLAWDEFFFDLNDYFICFNEILFNPEIVDMARITRF